MISASGSYHLEASSCARTCPSSRSLTPIRVLVADDHTVVRSSFRRLLDAQAGIEVVGEAANGREAVDARRRLEPDVALMDIMMPALDGIEATRQLRAPPARPGSSL